MSGQSFRKKPVVIQAVQWINNNFDEVNDFAASALGGWSKSAAGVYSNLSILTLEGSMRVSEGDYIIRGVNGEFYPCKPDIFVKTYDVVPTTGAAHE